MTTRRKSTGHVSKLSKHKATPYVIGGVAVAAVVGFLLWSRKSSAATPPATPPAGPTTSYTPLQQAVNAALADGGLLKNAAARVAAA